MAEGRVSGLHWNRRIRVGPPRVAGRNRRHCGHSGSRPMTFSIVARCETTGALGVAVASSSPAVAARCPYARSGVGAVASQNVTDPTLGPRSLDLMALGASADQAIAALCGSRAHMEYRQVLAGDARGPAPDTSRSKGVGGWFAC